MSDQSLRVKLWVVVCMVALMTMVEGCGGGGSSLSYSGKESAGQVGDGTDAVTWLTSGYGVFDALGVPAGTVVGPAWSTSATLPAQQMETRIATIEYSRTVDGDHEGSFTLDWLVNTFTGDFAGAISYDGFSDRQGDGVTGDADAAGNGFNQDAPPGEIGLTFSSLAVSKWSAGWKMSGDMSVQNFSAAQQGVAQPLVFLADSLLVIDSLVLKDRAGVTMKLENARIGIDLDGISYRFTIEDSGQTEAGARLYHPDHGYLYISTLEPVEISNESGTFLRGVIQIADEAGGYAWLWLDYQGTSYWEVWLDGGNGVLDYGLGDGADDTSIIFGTFSEGVFSQATPG